MPLRSYGSAGGFGQKPGSLSSATLHIAAHTGLERPDGFGRQARSIAFRVLFAVDAPNRNGGPGAAAKLSAITVRYVQPMVPPSPSGHAATTTALSAASDAPTPHSGWPNPPRLAKLL